MIDPRQVGKRLAQITPGQEVLTLRSRTNTPGSGDDYDDTTLTHCRRRPLTADEIAQAGGTISESWYKFQVYGPVETEPHVGDKLVDANSITYEIKGMPGSRTVQDVRNLWCMQDR